MAITCSECGHEIQAGTPIIIYESPLSLMRLGVDFERTYHGSCHLKAEAAAAEELRCLTAPQEATP